VLRVSFLSSLLVSSLLVVAGCVAQVSSSGGAGACQSGVTRSCTQANGYPGTQPCHDESWGLCTNASCTGDSFACTTPDGQRGVAQCVNGQSASVCGVPGECQPGQTMTGGTIENTTCTIFCAPADGGWQWDYENCDTPLVLAFDSEPVVFSIAAGAFDLSGLEATIPTDWVSARTPWLALDRNGNGTIDDGSELFGSMTGLPAGGRASNGFVALRALDDDLDGQITARDAAFERLLVWRDADQDRRSSPQELVSAQDAGLVAIRLDYQSVPRCTDGDCEVERASFVFRDGVGAEHEGTVVDVHLARR